MKNELKISIIVPIYNVEVYLRKCLDSIVNQTYKNLEIILVDDGSLDNCGRICDEYATNDERIKVIHKQNGGVSSARNAGLEIATGEYIGWVDSDDWIELDMFEYLVKNAQTYKADITVCSRIEQYETKSIFRGWQQVEIYNTEQALELLLQDSLMQNYLWDKLWRRELFDGIAFPEGRTFEDVAIAHELFIKAKSIICLPEAKYNYWQRTNSIVYDNTLSNRIDHYIAAKLRYERMATEWPQFEQLLLSKCIASLVQVWCCYLFNPKEEQCKFRIQIEEMAAFAKVNYKAELQYMDLGLAGRMVLRLTPYAKWWAFALAGFISQLYKRKHGCEL